MELKPLEEQVVVVMGASSGIGRQCALAFAAKGARVVVAARNHKALEGLVSEIESKGGKAISMAADVSNFAQVQDVATRAVAEWRTIDTWVNVAAVSVFSPFEETRPEEFRRVIDVNLLGQIYGTLAALPYLRRGGRGSLIQVSSIEGFVSFPFQSAYAAAKRGIAGFSDALRLELQRDGSDIQVTTILPASINTPLFEHARTRLGVAPQGAPPVYAPELVADAILYAAQFGGREIIVGGSGVLLALLQRLSPRLVDQILLTRVGFESQLTRRPKRPTEPNNLMAPAPLATYSVHGTLSREGKRRCLLTQLQESRLARWATMAMRPVLRGVANGFGVLWGMRYLPNLTREERQQARAGGGWPLPVVEEACREEMNLGVARMGEANDP